MLLRQVTVQYLIPVSYYLLFPEILPDSQRLNPVLLRLVSPSVSADASTDSVATSSAKTVAAGTATVMHAAINSPAKRLMFSSSKLSVLFFVALFYQHLPYLSILKHKMCSVNRFA